MKHAPPNTFYVGGRGRGIDSGGRGRD